MLLSLLETGSRSVSQDDPDNPQPLGCRDVKRVSHQEPEVLQPWPVIAVRLSGSSAHQITSYPFGCEPSL